MEFLGIRRGASGAIEVPSRLGEPCFEDAIIQLYGTRSEIHVRSMADGQSLVVLGTAFHRELGTNLSLLPSDLCFDLESFLRDIYFQLYGRFIIIYSNQSETLVFPDAGATRFLIYNEKTGYFSSGISLAQEAAPWASKDETSSDESLIRKVTGHYNVFGFTGFDNCRCLLPNHFLNGKYFSEIRFWPSQRNFVFDNNPKSNVWKKLDCELEFVTDSLFSLKKQILIPITSGRDSRTILAYFFDRGAKNVKTYTNLREGTKDLEYGRVLARSCDYDWSEDRPEGNHICLPGFGGEIFKLYWGQSLSKNDNDITERILRATPLFELIRCNAISQFARHHVKNLIALGLSEDKITDILYHELRWGCTMGEVHSKYDELFGLSFSFFASYQVVQCAESISDRDRRRMIFWKRLCKIRAPHLCILPAGIPHFDRRDLPMAFVRLAFGWLYPSRYRKLIYSEIYFETLVYSIRFWFNRMTGRRTRHRS